VIEENHTALHQTYCALTHRNMVLTTREHYGWNAFVAKGWTEDDLRLVIGFIQRRIKAGKRFPESFRFHNLILDQSRFADDLLDARAEARQPRPSAKDRLLASTNRPAPIHDNAVRADQVHERSQLALRLKAWKEANL